MRARATLVAVTLAASALAKAAHATRVDGFEDPSAWKPIPADGVRLELHADRGVHGQSLRLDFDFERGAGYAVIRRELVPPLELPENYAFSFRMRGEARPNHLEFKLVDPTNENVWWQRRPDVEFSSAWAPVTIKRRHITFAWGPAGGGVIRRVAAIEIAITAGQGGKGSVWLDDLELAELPLPDTTRHVPIATAASSAPGGEPANAVDGSPVTAWHSVPKPASALEVDWGGIREIGGLVVDWDARDFARDYTVLGSRDRRAWTPLHSVRGGNGGRDAMSLPETDARYVRLRLERSASGRGFGVRELAIRPTEWSGSRDSVVGAIAASHRRGVFPRWAYGEQSFWTVVGIDDDEPEALLGEDGALELGPGGPSVEPFLRQGDTLITWADVTTTRALAGDELPIPTVRWRHGALELDVTTVPIGSPGRSGVLARYRVRNTGATDQRVELLLAVRPFQVNPPWQFLGRPGGVARVSRLERRGTTVLIDGGDRRVVFSRAPRVWTAGPFEAGEAAEHADRGSTQTSAPASDPLRLASGLATFDAAIPAGEEREIAVLSPFAPWTPPDAEARALLANSAALQDSAVRRWRAALGDVRIELPAAGQDLLHTLRAALAYVLVNRDGPALQPGSRAYDRSWIRDGALTSVALLRLGRYDVVREFIDWFAAFQYPNGKVPCCIDARGPDPVPEHDSHGELMFAIAEYARHTGDTASVARWWPNVRAAARYLDQLRHERLTPEYDAPERREFRGLLPPSISHEGYSAKPMHSYWDDFFALRGLDDAAWLASLLGHGAEHDSLAAIAQAFRADLSASIPAAMRRHRIDYVPGCADLGDFDATSTTVALGPLDVAGAAPAGAVRATFERYWKFFDARREGAPWDAFTPYELRTVGSAVRLGWRDRANTMLEFFMAHRTPPEWRQWAEVVWHDPRAPRFIGDLPHTWVGSDFIRSALDLFAYESLSDGTLVLGAGVPGSWVEQDSIAIHGLSTPWGRLSYRMGRTSAGLEVTIEPGITVPPGGIVLRPPGVRAGAPVRGGQGADVRVRRDGTVIVRRVPIQLTIAP